MQNERMQIESANPKVIDSIPITEFPSEVVFEVTRKLSVDALANLFGSCSFFKEQDGDYLWKELLLRDFGTFFEGQIKGTYKERYSIVKQRAKTWAPHNFLALTDEQSLAMLESALDSGLLNEEFAKKYSHLLLVESFGPVVQRAFKECPLFAKKSCRNTDLFPLLLGKAMECPEEWLELTLSVYEYLYSKDFFNYNHEKDDASDFPLSHVYDTDQCIYPYPGGYEEEEIEYFLEAVNDRYQGKTGNTVTDKVYSVVLAMENKYKEVVKKYDMSYELSESPDNVKNDRDRAFYKAQANAEGVDELEFYMGREGDTFKEGLQEEARHYEKTEGWLKRNEEAKKAYASRKAASARWYSEAREKILKKKAESKVSPEICGALTKKGFPCKNIKGKCKFHKQE